MTDEAIIDSSTNQNDEKLESRDHSNYQSAILRAHNSGEAGGEYSSPVEFSWRQFWQSFLYENIPPGIFSPILALIIERSITRAWFVCQNRGLCPISTKYNSRGFIISSWLFFFPGSWLLTSALVITIFGVNNSSINIDFFLVIISFACLFMRRIIVSIKYGYFRPEIYEKLSKPAPEWDGDKTRRQLVTWGWSKPSDYPGLIEDELIISMEENDVSLEGICFELDQETVDAFKRKDKDTRFKAQTGFTKDHEVTAAFLLTEFLKFAYERNPQLEKLGSSMKLMTAIFALSLPAIVIIASLSYGQDFFGTTTTSFIVAIGTIIGFFLCHQLLLFGLLCRFDFKRRKSAIELMGDAIENSGVSLSQIYPDDEALKEQDQLLFINLEKRANVFAWTITRRVLKSFGEAFYNRIQGYTSILFLFSLVCVGILNLLFWGAFDHHISTIVALVTIVTGIAFVSIRAIFSAIDLQRLSETHRDRIRKKMFVFEEKAAFLDADKSDSYRDSSFVRSLLQQADETLSFHELTYKPVMLLGYPASRSLIGSFLGILFTGLVLALEGFSGSGISYDLFGWFKG
tara:strand:+ start:2699 stop:4417 length:1719 start_codon:yes stop_codon:yes gene_type:complete